MDTSPPERSACTPHDHLRPRRPRAPERPPLRRRLGSGTRPTRPRRSTAGCARPPGAPRARAAGPDPPAPG